MMNVGGRLFSLQKNPQALFASVNQREQRRICLLSDRRCDEEDGHAHFFTTDNNNRIGEDVMKNIIAALTTKKNKLSIRDDRNVLQSLIRLSVRSKI